MTKILRPEKKPVNLKEVKGTKGKATLYLCTRATPLQPIQLKARLVRPGCSVTVLPAPE